MASEAFTITLDGVEYPVVVDSGKIIVNGRPFQVSVKEDGSVLVDGIAHHVALEGDTANVDEETYAVDVSGLSVGGPAPIKDEGVVSVAEKAVGTGAVVAIMPGKITRVMVEEGDEVEPDEAVCILEAMKMENELRVEAGGVVTAVRVKPGDDVEKNQVLVEVE